MHALAVTVVRSVRHLVKPVRVCRYKRRNRGLGILKIQKSQIACSLAVLCRKIQKIQKQKVKTHKRPGQARHWGRETRSRQLSRAQRAAGQRMRKNQEKEMG